MKVQIPQISWHSRDPVLSIDFQPIQSNKYRLASGGTDSHVLIWYVTYEDDKTVKIECASDLNRHSKSVNVVRFSPNGETLASGDDEGAMFVWQLREGDDMDMIKDSKDDEIVNKEEWYPVKVLRAHLEDIYDISWSSDGNFLVTASMDNYAIIWDMQKYVKVHMLSDFKGYVQGVSWDPCNKFIASLGSDRTLRVHSVKSKKTLCRISKTPWPKSAEIPNVKGRLFYDDTLKSYCRRLTYTPDGELLIVPSGIVEKGEKLLNTCYVFSRHSMSKPVLSLQTKDWYTVAVRCNPFFYKLRGVKHDLSDKENEKKCMIDLPYRMIFAVAACDSVLMYDTEQLLPFACISNIHYTRLTDLAWSPDGLTLVASSTDGYCSFIVFTKEELGEIYVPEKVLEPEPDKNEVSNKQETSDVSNLNQTPQTNKSTKQKSETPKTKSPKQQKSETPKTESPQQQKSEAQKETNPITPSQVTLAQSSTESSATPALKAIGTSEKKSDKNSPKIGSIKKYFTATKTSTVSSPAERVTELKSIKLGENVAIAKTDPIVITLDSTPVKKGQSLKVEEKASSIALKTPDPLTVASEDEKMDVDHNTDASDKSLTKKGKCRVRLDFDEKKKNPTISSSNDDEKQKSTTDGSLATDLASSADVTINVADPQIKSISVERNDIRVAVEKEKSNLVVESSSVERMEIISSSNNPKKEEMLLKEFLSVKSKNKKLALDAKKSSEIVSDEPMEITAGEFQLSFCEEFASSKTNSDFSIDAKKKIEPAILFDENASDGDNTTTSVSDLKSEANDGNLNATENDWKLELSQDTVPSVSHVKTPVPRVEQNTPESKTPKRRVAFVTLSSKPSLKK